MTADAFKTSPLPFRQFNHIGVDGDNVSDGVVRFQGHRAIQKWLRLVIRRVHCFRDCHKLRFPRASVLS